MIDYIKIEGFKSIKKMEMALRPINILIGSNGSGKSNFISFFKLLNAIFNGRLQRYVIEMDNKADGILYFGRKHTELMTGKIIFTKNRENNNAYHFGLAPSQSNELFLDYEGIGFNVSKEDNSQGYFYEHNLLESNSIKNNYPRNKYLKEYMLSLQVFHFHDTSATSYLRRECDINDNLFLKQDGRNLAAFLYFLKIKHSISYNRIEKIIKSIAPYIEKLLLEPNSINEKEIGLRWIDKGDIESSFSAYQLSDGTLRFIALTALLMQPNPPSVIIIDEPELGLHPFAISKLAGMIQSASSKAQIIVATQSPSLISNFSPEDIVIIDRSKEENQTVFNRLSSDALNTWLEDYSLGDLWERNILNAAQPYLK